MNNYDYPPGSDTPRAPWNQTELPEQEVEVTISVTLSKTVKVVVKDYELEESADEDGCCLSYDFSNCDFYKIVDEQVCLPQELAVFTERMFEHDLNLKAAKMPKYLKDAIKDCKDWSIDEIEIIPE